MHITDVVCQRKDLTSSEREKSERKIDKSWERREADRLRCFKTAESSRQPPLHVKDVNWGLVITSLLALKCLGVDSSLLPKTRKKSLVLSGVAFDRLKSPRRSGKSPSQETKLPSWQRGSDLPVVVLPVLLLLLVSP